jgi:hypothetical protein
MLPVQSVGCGDVRMVCDMDLVFGKDLLVSGPSILHILLSFKAGENEDDGDFLFAKPLMIVEELVMIPDKIYQLITRPLPVGDRSISG